MSNYRSGAAFEQELARLFREWGYCVVRGAASKGKLLGYDADLIVSKQTPQTKYEAAIAIIQCKRTKR